jgi:signal transduction histidine kinase
MKNALDIILKATDTATNVLQRLRKLNDTGGPTIKTKPIDAWRAVHDALELVDFQLRKRFIRVSKARSRPFVILGNRHSLVQVFVNIFINSMHAMPDGGDLQIGVSKVDDMLEITVRDTGPGVPDHVLPRVTEPLFTTKGDAGSGLGLSICKEIVEFEHGGELVIGNHAAGGLEVLVRLPAGTENNETEKKS